MSQKRSRREYEEELRKQEAPFVIYGTPLPPLDDNARDDGSYVPLWKQDVTDERGRKRLHGAFTGGYSAGYFNTVGSKEGWTPSTFVSSRLNRAKDAKDLVQQNIEDFMDEEDIKEREESRQIQTSEAFAGFGNADDTSTKSALDDVFRLPKETMGNKLLHRMGWKNGQGIGPRVSRRINPQDAHPEIREFPPADTDVLIFEPKHDTRGLGFGGTETLSITNPRRANVPIRPLEDHDEENDSRPGLSFMKQPRAKSKKQIRGGIGTGVLNDTGSGDEDPYEMGPKMSLTRAFSSDKKPKKVRMTSSTSNANPLLKDTPVFIPKTRQLPSAISSLRKCHDGKLPLAGFLLADALETFSSMSLSDEKYKPPEVPDDWQPSKAAAAVAITKTESTASSQIQTAESRRAALGEISLPSKSVFDFLTPTARDRLATASGNQNLPPALGELPPTPSSTDTFRPLDPNLLINASSAAIPALAPETARTALTRLRKDKSPPYSDDLAKQGRYKDFLRYSSGDNRSVPPLRAPQHKSSSDEAHLAELGEFAATAQLFKPATGFLASRFTSASSSTTNPSTSSDPNPVDESASTTKHEQDQGDPATAADLLYRPPPAKPADPAEEAARMGMFGPATRSVKGWMPTRLVCKRFGVDMPIDFGD